MPRRIPIKFLLTGIIVLAVVILAVAIKSSSGKVDLKAVTVQRAPNGIIKVTVVLLNNARHTMNVCDDGRGGPEFALDSGGDLPVAVTPMANTLKLNLAPAASLTNTITLTNPPSRFRLQAAIRDLRGESRTYQVGRFLSFLPTKWQRQVSTYFHDYQTPKTDWIEIPALGS